MSDTIIQSPAPEPKPPTTVPPSVPLPRKNQMALVDGDPVPRGVVTTEFWVVVGTSIAAIAGAMAGILPPQYAAIATTISTGIYTVCRTIAKP